MAKVENGCELWADCFSCPYPDCIWGNSGKVIRERRDEAMREERDGGMKLREIAMKYGVSLRTVGKVLRC